MLGKISIYIYGLGLIKGEERVAKYLPDLICLLQGVRCSKVRGWKWGNTKKKGTMVKRKNI